MTRTIRFTLNDEKVSAEIAAHHTIVEVLRERFDLFGARESCAQALCGCCTVLVDGEAVSGCLYLASFADGAQRDHGRASRGRRQALSGAGSVSRVRRRAVRLLHAGVRADDRAIARAASRPG